MIFTKNKITYYYIGLPKTGSKSLAGILKKYNAQHEFLEKELLYNFVKMKKGEVSESNFSVFLKNRKQKVKSQYDIATCHYHYLDILKNDYNNHFIISLRSPVSWINSFVNFKHQQAVLYNQPYMDENNPIISYFIGKEISSSYFLDLDYLIENIEEWIDDLFLYWSKGIEALINHQPKNCLILNFNRREENLKAIIKFLNIKEKKLDLNQWNLNVTENKINIFEGKNQPYIEYIENKAQSIYHQLHQLGIENINEFEPFILK